MRRSNVFKRHRKLAAGLVLIAALASTGCARLGGPDSTPDYDRPFPLGAVTDAHWETQQTNAEASDFVFYDHEFVGETSELAPGAKRHIEQVAIRLEHTNFPIVIEQSQHNAKPSLDGKRRQTIIDALARMGIVDVDKRVVVSSAFGEGFTGIEGERAYLRSLGGNGNALGGRFGGRGGVYR